MPKASPQLALQIALDRAGFSPGVLDGKPGKNTENALRAFQTANNLEATGKPDSQTIEQLGAAYQNPLSAYAISADDVNGPFVEQIPEEMIKKAELQSLGYTSAREMLAERFHATPELLDRLNPNVQWKHGEVIAVPNVQPFFVPTPGATDRANGDRARPGSGQRPDATRADTTAGTTKANPIDKIAGEKAPAATDLVVTVSEQNKTLTVEDATGKLIFHAPVTTGSEKDPLPIGEWKVNGVERNPKFHYNPDLFWDADAKDAKATIPPGPNNPVGTVWIDLSKEHYGIHGTPEPSRIGYTESHGCIRLTNWDAMRLAALVGPGTRVVLR